MNFTRHIQKIVDQLMYNQLYATDYPTEDRTSLDRQAALINDLLAQAIAAAEKREDIGDWLRLASHSIHTAFEKYRKGDSQTAQKEIEAAIGYLRNASSKEPHKRTFLTMPDGTTKPVT